MSEAEGRGLELARYEGGHKPHITVAHAIQTPQDSPPQIRFQTEPMHELHTYYDSLKRKANILDPIRPELTPLVFDDSADDKPKLKPVHRKWITSTVHKTLEDAGYEGMGEWLSLVFTGSLTTYQFSDESDVDISLFVDVKNFPEWSRSEMIALMIEKMDGVELPGTPYPMQCFVVPPEVSREDLYKPGMRSGYNLDTDDWIVPPERERVRDVEATMSAQYVHALQQADKMANLLKYEPRSAILLWHQIKRRRRRDMKMGKGDYSNSNIVYKMLANRGIFPLISELTGQYIARTGSELHIGLEVPKDVAKKIHTWVKEQDWPEGTNLEDPSDYHITLVYAEDGHEDHAEDEWRHAETGYDAEVTGLDLFGDGDEKATVLKIKSPDVVRHAEDVMDVAKDRGIEINKFPGGYKPHITVAYGPDKPKGKPLKLQFKTGPSSVSEPREKTSWYEIDGLPFSLPEIGDSANGSTVVDIDNLTTYLEDGRILPGEEVEPREKTALFGPNKPSKPTDFMLERMRAAEKHRVDQWDDMYQRGIDPNKGDFNVPLWADKHHLDSLHRALTHNNVKPKNYDPAGYTPEMNVDWHRRYQEDKRQKYLNDPSVSAEDYEHWQNWYAQHAPEHFDPDGIAANAEVAAIEPPKPRSWVSSSKVVNGGMEYRSVSPEEEWQISQPWKLGKDGKGLIINDVPHIWSVDHEGEPHHSQISEEDYLWVVISPTGEVDGEDESMEQFFENCHPDLHAIRLAWDAEQEAMWDIVQQKEIPVREGGLPPIVSASWPVVTKFVYNIPTNHLVIGKTAKEEGEVESHADLLKHAQLEPKNNIYGQFDPSGRAVSLGRPRIEGFGKSEMTPYEAEYRAKQAVEGAVPGVTMNVFKPGHDKWNIDSPKVTYVHEPPVVDKQAEPSSDDWTFSKVARHRVIPEAIEEMRNRHGLQNQVRVLPMPQGRDPRAGYAGIDRDPMTGKPSHRIYLNHDTPIGAANWALHHELGHALQTERDGHSADTTGLSDEEYKNSPREKEAEELAGQHADLSLLK